MSQFEDTIREIIRFRDERDWKQFHNAKDLALAISIEAGELNELFLWKDAEEVDRAKLREELADVFIFSIFLAHEQGIDVQEIISEKLKKANEKYPVEKARGNAKKYDQL